MRAKRRRCDRVTVENSTWSAKNYMQATIKLARLFEKDPEKAKRREESLCPVHYYQRSRIGGAACTSVQCALCDQMMHYGNTCVDVVCDACAKKHSLCKHCGGDIDAVKRRKQREFDRECIICNHPKSKCICTPDMFDHIP